MSAICREQSLLVRFKTKWYIPIYHMGISCGHRISAHIQHFFVFWKKGLKIPKGQSESLNRRICVSFTKRNTTKRQSKIYTTLHRKQKIEHSESHSKTFRCPVRVDKSCSTCDICRITLITNPVICHERESDCVVVTTIGENEWVIVA
jgi:hypothetical protein